MQYFLIWIEWYGLYSIFIPVYAFLVLPILAAVGGDTKRFLERTAKVQWGLMVCVFCISHVPALLTLQIPGFEGRNLLLIAFLVIVVQGSDVLQYVWGKLFGKRKVAPELSPSKTWEGLVGGVASATALGAALYWTTPFNPWQAALMALTICVMGFFGGLVMSAIKRDRGVKDWGTMIEGHGGMLDRLDSVIFAAPIYFHALRYWWVPATLTQHVAETTHLQSCSPLGASPCATRLKSSRSATSRPTRPRFSRSWPTSASRWSSPRTVKPRRSCKTSPRSRQNLPLKILRWAARRCRTEVTTDRGRCVKASHAMAEVLSRRPAMRNERCHRRELAGDPSAVIVLSAARQPESRAGRRSDLVAS